jgi:hypothetical protein
MKIAVIGAGGRLGNQLVKKALDRGHSVIAMIHNTPCQDPRAEQVQKGLFDLTPADLEGYDALLSAYGSGFDAAPEINRQAMNRLADLVAGTETRMLSIAGAGCLFTDETKTQRVYEQPSHPAFLKGISHNTTLGVEDVKGRTDVHWTFVHPGVLFDGEGPDTGKYLTSENGCVPVNEAGKSYTSYADLAGAMLDFLEQGKFDRTQVTVVSAADGNR